MSRSGKKRRKHHVLQTTRFDVDSGAAAAAHVSHAHEPAKLSGSFGAMLLHARTEQGLSHDDVTRDTRVAKRYVLALENESLSSLPGGLYNRAYVRTYAAYLGLDPHTIVRDYDRTVHEQGAGRGLAAPRDQIDALRAAIQQKESQRPGRTVALGTFKGPVVVSMVLILLAGGVWVGVRHFSHPAGMMLAQLSTADAVVSESEPPVSDSEKQPVRFDAAPVRPMLENTRQSAVSEVRQAQTSISVSDSGVGTDVVARDLVGRSDTFAAGTRIVFWTLVAGGRPGDTIRHAWFHQGRTVATVRLPIAGATWRTHSQRLLGRGAEGEWVVEAQDEHGRILARHAFRSEP